MAGTSGPPAQRARDTDPADGARDHLALAGGGKLAGAAARVPGVADGVWLVPQVAGARAV